MCFIFLSRGGLLNLFYNLLQLITDLGGDGGELIVQPVHHTLKEGAHLLAGGLQLGPEVIGLALQLLAQPLSLVPQRGGELSHLLAGGVHADVGLDLLPGRVQVLGGPGLQLTQVGGHGAEDTRGC